MKKIYITTIVIVITISVCIYITNYKQQNEKLWGTTDVISDEETAEKIAYILIDKLFGFNENRDYGVEVSFNDESYAWEVKYFPLLSLAEKEQNIGILGGGRYIHIRKDSGKVIYASRG